MLYNVVLISAIQQCESAISIHMAPPSWTSLPRPPHPFPLGCLGAWGWASLSYSNSPSAVYFTFGNIHISVFNLSHPLLPPLCPQFCSLCLCLYSCPANWFISAIFLFHVYALTYNICFSLTSLCMTMHIFDGKYALDSAIFVCP